MHGHASWVKNIEYDTNTRLLVTSGFDGNVITWDTNRSAIFTGFGSSILKGIILINCNTINLLVFDYVLKKFFFLLLNKAVSFF